MSIDSSMDLEEEPLALVGRDALHEYSRRTPFVEFVSDHDECLKVHPVADAILREEFEPCSNMFPHADGEVLNDEVVIIDSSGSAGKSKVFEPYTGVRLPGILGDVGSWSKALWEWCSLDASAIGPWSRAI